MKVSVKTGAKGEPMATPSIWLYKLLLKIKRVCHVAKRITSMIENEIYCNVQWFI